MRVGECVGECVGERGGRFYVGAREKISVVVL